jgi:hypothetical protein
VEGAAAEVLEEFVQTRVDERVAEAVEVAQRQLHDEVKDSVDIALLDSVSAEHAKVEVERRRVAELEERLRDAERRATQREEAERRAQQAEHGRREANARASALEADINAMRARAAPQAPATVLSSRRFVAPMMTPINPKREDSRPPPASASEDIARAQAHRVAIEAELKRLTAERDAAAAHITALQSTLQNERAQAQLFAQWQSQYGVAVATAASASAPLTNTDKIPHAPVYTGLPGSSERGFYDWKPALEIYFRVKQWSTISDATKCIDYASTRLDKDAARWYVEEYLPTAPEIASWVHFATALADKFEHASESAAARVKLQHFRQGSSSVADYNAKFSRLISRIKDMAAKDKLLAYLHGLHPKYKDKIIGHVETVDEAMKKALIIDESLTVFNAAPYRPYNRFAWQPRSHAPTPVASQANNASGSSSSNSSSSSTPMELGNVEGEYHREPSPTPGDDDDDEIAAMQSSSRNATRRPLAAEQQRLYKEQRCFECKQRGHMRRDCPQAARHSKNE